MYGLPPTPPAPGSWLGATSGPIDRDVVCRKCGYNLRGLGGDGRCPECGTAVGFSLQGDLLRFCDPGWVETLRRGAAVFVGAVVIFFIAYMTVLFPQWFEFSREVFELVWYGMLLACLLFAVAWWLMTQPDPSGLGEDRYGTARKVIRITLVYAVVNFVAQLLGRQFLIGEGLDFVLSGMSLLAVVALVASIVAQLSYLRRLALRIPDHKLSKRAGFLTFALSVPLGLFLLMAFVPALTGGGRGAMRGTAAGCFAGILAILVLIFGAMYLLLVEKMGKRFKEQSSSARLSWAATEFSRAAPPAA